MKVRSFLLTTSILLTFLAVVPSAEAHPCVSATTACGPCPTTGDHVHADGGVPTACLSAGSVGCVVSLLPGPLSFVAILSCLPANTACLTSFLASSILSWSLGGLLACL